MRGNDSLETFEEILRAARDQEVWQVLLTCLLLFYSWDSGSSVGTVRWGKVLYLFSETRALVQLSICSQWGGGEGGRGGGGRTKPCTQASTSTVAAALTLLKSFGCV